MDDLKLFKLHMGPARCAVDLGDGSERGEYVSQDYIISKLGRPHRNINLMYCYYPLDRGWPARASLAHKSDAVSFAWDFPYDDYFPYTGGPGGSTDGEPFLSMKDIRRHGQDVTLTLTMDCAVPDGHLVQIARELKPYGRMHLRINHEATGNWFAFNKRYSYQEVADFFVRFHNILKKEAPNIWTILCIGGGPGESPEGMPYEKEFSDAVRAADIWSGDYYLALNWGWPYTVAERNGKTHKRMDVESVFEANCFSFERFKKMNGGIPKPLVISELNADGDVTGPYDQAEMMKDFYFTVRDREAAWLSGLTCYQFRDRGRLGLETEDPSNADIGIEQPMLKVYRDVIHDPYFMASMETGEKVELPAVLRWGSFEDSDGLAVPMEFKANPVFCEVSFDEAELNLMMELNGQWFYKKPGVKTIDLMYAFYNKPLPGPAKMVFKLFAPPADGMNDPAQGDDWAVNFRTTINAAPRFRVRYEPTETGFYTP